MFCCHAVLVFLYPSEAIEQLRAAQCDEIVLLPLYPQYSSTTTGSSRTNGGGYSMKPPVRSIETFYRSEAYLDAVVEKVNEALSRFPAPTD